MASSFNEHPLARKLQNEGHRLTPQRLAILDVLMANTGHPSAQEIFHELQPRFPTMSLATVYNTMSLLVEMGLVKEIKLADDGVRYDVNNEPHLNLYCRKCQSIIDMPYAPLSELHQSVRDTKGFALDDTVIELSGICSECR